MSFMMLGAGKNFGNDCLRLASGRKVAIVIWEAQYSIGVADVNPLRIFTWRVEGNAERTVQSCRKSRLLLRFSIFRDSTKNCNFAFGTLGQEDIAIGCRQ